MLVPNQMIEIKWGRTNSTHYKKLGYTFTKIGDTFKVKAEDLLPNSKAIVQVKCDSCGKITTTTYQSYLASLKNHDLYYCKSCVQKMQFTIQKKEKTLNYKYGNDCIFKTEYFKEKSKQTNLTKLGVEYPMQSKVVQNKSQETAQKHGILLGFKNPQSLQKALVTLANNGQVPTSSQQLQLYEYLKDNYITQLNAPLNTLNLDIVVNINNVLIDIEVDGIYWHNDSLKDRRRDEFVKSQGYKILRITINHTLPAFEEIEAAIQKLITSQHSFYQIAAKDVDNNKA